MRGITLIIPLLFLALVSSHISDADYALNLEGDSGSFATINPFDFGARYYTIMAHARVADFSGTKTLFHAYGSSADLEVQISLLNSNRLSFKIGTQTFTTGTMNLGISANTMFSLVVSVSETSGTTTLSAWVNNVLKVTTQINSGAFVGVRSAHIGSDKNGNNRWNGVIDNLVIVNDVVSATIRQSHAASTKNWSPDTSLYGRLALWINFDDSAHQLEQTAIAIVSVDGIEVNWVEVILHGAASFTLHVPRDQWTSCYATGDPHGVLRGSKIHGVEHQKGGKVFLGCTNVEVEVRTYMRYKCWWGATVATLIGTRYQDYLWRINLEERHSAWDDTRSGTPYCRLGYAPGSYTKHIHDEAWSAIPYGTSIHSETGVRITHTNQGSGRFQLVVDVPSTINVRADANVKYINWYVSVNEAVCTLDQSTCKLNLGVNGRVDFKDWLPPVELPDFEVPEDDPCTGIATDIVNYFEQACSAYYTDGSDLHADCVFDACASGDPELIAENDLTPGCLIERITSDGESSPSCNVGSCYKNCYGRGTCNTLTGVCENCDAGYTGNDCYQEETFNCYTASYGSVSMNIEPTKIFNTFTIADVFSHYTVFRSLLIDPITKGGDDFLKFVVSSENNQYSGSARVCINTIAGADPEAPIFVAKPAGSVGLGSVSFTQVQNTGSLCVNMNWPKFSTGGFYIKLAAGSQFNIAVDQKTNLEQVLFASKNGRGGVDVAKIPESEHQVINFAIEDCDNSQCAAQDGNCGGCYALTGCGFCQESQRCMRGDSAGPKRGICGNWRYALEDDISRVVTTIYNGDDLVDPDFQVELGSIPSGSSVPVSIYVPTGSGNKNVDIYFALGTAGSYALNAPTLKSNLLSALSNIPSNLAIGYYSAIARKTTLTSTRVHANNQYLFGRAMEAPTGFATTQNGGQLELLSLIAGPVSVGFRDRSKQLVLVMTYDIADLTSLEATRTAVLNKGFLPVWLIPSDVPQSVVDFYQNLSDRIDGIPSIIVRVDPSGSNFDSVFRNVISLADSFPHIVINDESAEFTNVDMVSLSANSDSLSILGLTNSQFRARFVIPMKASSTDNFEAKFTVPGFGFSKISDVASIVPTSNNIEAIADEGVECLDIIFEGTTFGVVAPIFEVLTAPTRGTLHENNAGVAGAEVTVGHLTSGKLCFVPKNQYDYADDQYDSFTYSTTDACQASAPSTVSVFIQAVVYRPVAKDVLVVIDEDEQDLPSFQKDLIVTGFDADRDISGDLEEVMFTYTQISSGVFFQGASPLAFSPVNYAGFYPTEPTYETSQVINYKPSHKDDFGLFTVEYTVTDATGLVSDTKTITVEVVPVNDDPVFVNFADREHQSTAEDVPGTVVVDFFDIDSPVIYVDVELVSLKAGTVTLNGNAVTEGTKILDACQSVDHSVSCELVVTPAANDNSCSHDFSLSGIPQDMSAECPTAYAVFKFSATDKNTLVKPGTPGVTEEKIVQFHVLAVNDKPEKPADRVINLKENDMGINVDVLAEDIDSLALDLDIFLSAEFSSITGIKLYQVGTSGQKTDEITNTTELNDYNLKRVSQNHRFIIDTVGDFYGTGTNWAIDQPIKVKAYDGFDYSADATYTITVKPINDPPVNTATEFSFLEDECINSQIFDPNCVFTFGAVDVDNSYGDLTFALTSIPSVVDSGIQIYSVMDGFPGSLITSIGDLPADPEDNKVKLFFVVNPNWFGDFTLEYTITDTDANLDSSDLDYKVNSVPSSSTIKVGAVNDAPALNVRAPSAMEDTPVEISLLGTNNKFGEDDDVLAAQITDLKIAYPNSDVSNSSGFYRYSEAVFNAFLADPTVDPVSIGATKVLVGDVITAAEDMKMIFVPSLNFNYEACSKSDFGDVYCITASYRYKIIETSSVTSPLLSSPVSSNINIYVEKVNDLPFVFNDNQWPLGTPQVNALYGISAATWPEIADDICFENCQLNENLGEVVLPGGEVSSKHPIYFGGRDTEFSSLNVLVTSIDCVSGASLYQSAADDALALDLVNFVPTVLDCELTFVENVGYELVDCLYFKPKGNDWNVINEDEGDHPSDTSGQEADHYCEIQYEVVDVNGGISSERQNAEPFTITINVLQINTQPIESFEHIDDISGSVELGQLTSKALLTQEATDLYVYLNAVDVESDDYVATVICNSKGSWFEPAAGQSDFITNGILDISQPKDILFSETEIDCTTGHILSDSFAATGSKGWYILYNPGYLSGADGANYGLLTIEYDDNKVDGQQPGTSSRTISVRKFNDAPIFTVFTGTEQEMIFGGSVEAQGILEYTVPTPVSLGEPKDFGITVDDTSNALFRFSLVDWPQGYEGKFDEMFFWAENLQEFTSDKVSKLKVDWVQETGTAVFPNLYPTSLDNLYDTEIQKHYFGAEAKSIRDGGINEFLINAFEVTFNFAGQYTIELSLDDGGKDSGLSGGYCSPSVADAFTAFNPTDYHLGDIRLDSDLNNGNPIVEGALFNYRPDQCNRETTIHLIVNVQVSQAVTRTAMMSAAGGILLIAAIVGAVVAAKQFQPAETDAWNAIGNADVTHMEMSAIHEAGSVGGMSQVYQSRDSIVN